MFQSTRRFTETWIGKLVNYVILQVLTVAISSLVLSVITSIINVALSDVLQTAMAVIAICFAAAYIFVQLPGIASALAAGGAALNMGTPMQHGANAASRGATTIMNKVKGAVS
jgi:type IV secretion system protein VirB6